MINTGEVSDAQTQGKKAIYNAPGIGLCGVRGNIPGGCHPFRRYDILLAAVSR